VIGITERQRQRVSKYRRCFLESDTVLPTVRRCLDGVPLELHASILGRQDEPGKARGNEAGALFEQRAEAACASVSHHEREVAELRADRELAIEYLEAAMAALEVTQYPIRAVWE
jgi:hypothetical protein